MRRKHIARLVTSALILLLVFSITGCGRVDNTIAEPDEITTEYLYGEYSEQLIRDGAEVTLGTVALEPSGDNAYNITVHNMLIVESDITDYGYYVADENISTISPLDTEARITYTGNENTKIITPDEFAEIVSADNYDPLEEGSEELYEVYTMNGTVLMILAKELPTAE